MSLITKERFWEVFEYEPSTSACLVNRIQRSSRALAGQVAGTVSLQGYRQVQFAGTIYKEHRLIWFMMTGKWPDEIDHINGDRLDNRFVNLREVTRSQNNANSERPAGASGLRGVIWIESSQKWRAQMRIRGQHVHLGLFDTAEAAHSAYLVAADKIYGDHAYHNRPKGKE